MNEAVCDAKFSSVIALSFEGKTVEMDCLVADLFSGCDLLIGKDVVLCWVNIDFLGKVCFINKQSCNVSLQLDYSNFDV